MTNSGQTKSEIATFRSKLFRVGGLPRTAALYVMPNTCRQPTQEGCFILASPIWQMIKSKWVEASYQRSCCFPSWKEFLLQLATGFLSSLMLAFSDLICSKLGAADKFSQILWHFQTNPFHCWENPDEIMWKAFSIGCRDWENKAKRNFTEHTRYNNIEENNQAQVCDDLYLKDKFTFSILKVSKILQLLCTPHTSFEI